MSSTSDAQEAGSVLQDVFTVLKKSGDTLNRNLRELVQYLSALCHNSVKEEIASDAWNIHSKSKLIHLLRPYVSHDNCYVRAAALRALRYICFESDSIRLLWKTGVQYFVSRSLECDPEVQDDDSERVQAVKLIFYTSIKKDVVPPLCLVRSIVSIASSSKDSLRLPCLDVLVQMSVVHTGPVSAARGISCLVDSLLDPLCRELHSTVLQSLLYLLNDECTRKFLHVGEDFLPLFSPFTELVLIPESSATKSGSNTDTDKAKLLETRKEVLTLHRDVIIEFMKSWAGLICFFDSEYCFPSLVSVLMSPAHTNIKTIILDIFSALVNMGDRFTVLDSFCQLLLDNYKTMLIFGLRRCRVVEALVHIAYDMKNNLDPILVSRAAHLLSDLSIVLNHLLRKEHLEYLSSSIDKVILDTLDRTSDVESTPSTGAVTGATRTDKLADTKEARAQMIHMLNKLHLLQQASDTPLAARPMLTAGLAAGPQQNCAFDSLLTASLVLETKEDAKWNWDSIGAICRGHILYDVGRFREALACGFVGRLLKYFKPLRKNHRCFAALTKSDEYEHISRIACDLLRACLRTHDGFEALARSGFLVQIVESLSAEVETGRSSALDKSRVFSVGRINDGVTGEYFRFLGLISSSERGCLLLQTAKVFNFLFALTDASSHEREDIALLVLEHFDFTKPGLTQSLLQSMCRSKSKHVRMFATVRLSKLFSKLPVEAFREWGMQLLVTQLRDGEEEVRMCALMVLTQAARQADYLAAIVHHRPVVGNMLRPAQQLLTMYVGTESGLKYVKDLKWMEQAMGYWKKEGSRRYVVKLESCLQQTFDARYSPPVGPEAMLRDPYTELDDDSAVDLAAVGLVPPNLYSYLVQTEEGCTYLERSGHVDHYTGVLRSLEADMEDRRAALWALGHMGTSVFGIELLCRHRPVLQTIVQLAQLASSLSLRGTCYYVLGLIASSGKAQCDALRKEGWCVRTVGSGTYGNIPESLSMLLQFPRDYIGATDAEDHDYESTAHRILTLMDEYKMMGATRSADSKVERTAGSAELSSHTKKSSLSSVQVEVVKHIMDLLNPVRKTAATKQIRLANQDHYSLFADGNFYMTVLMEIEDYHYPISLKKSVHELFGQVHMNHSAWDRFDRYFSPKYTEDYIDHFFDGASKVSSRRGL